MRKVSVLIGFVICIGATAINAVGAQDKPVVIESQVTGSQEQPKVLYITPWQGINQPIVIEDKAMQITLPTFAPINPKLFQQEVQAFALEQTAVLESTSPKAK